MVTLKQANLLEISAPAASGFLVTNPPYGVRLSEQQELAEFYPKLGDVLKKKFSGWNAYIFSADPLLPKLIRLTPSRRVPLFNGALECRLLEYKMVAGGNAKGEENGLSTSSPINSVSRVICEPHEARNKSNFSTDISRLRQPGQLRPLFTAGKESVALSALRCSARCLLAGGIDRALSIFPLSPRKRVG